MTAAPLRGRPRVWPVFVTFIIAGVLMLAGSVAVLLALRQRHLSDLSRLLAPTLIGQLMLAATALVAGRPFEASRFRLCRGRTSARLVIAAVVGTLALGQALDCALGLSGLQDYGALADLRRVIGGIGGESLVRTLLVIALVAGIAEELFFRGYIQTRLSQRFRPSTAVLITSALFGLLHLDLVHSPLAFVLGIWLGTVAERSGSLFPSMTAHVVNNAVVTLATAGQFGVSGLRANLAVLSVSLLVLIVCARVLVRRPTPPLPQLEPTAAA